MKRAPRKLQLRCVFRVSVSSSRAPEFLKELVNVVNETLCTCEHPTNVLK